MKKVVMYLYDLPQSVIETINEKLDVVQTYMHPFIYTLIGLEVVTIGIFMAAGSMSDGGTVLLRILKVVFLFYIVTNVHRLGYVLLDGFRAVAFNALDITEGSDNMFDNPVDMLEKLKETFVEPLKKQLTYEQEIVDASQGFFQEKIVEPLILKMKQIAIMVVYYIIFILFSILFLQLLIAKLEFTVIIFFSVILAPFMINDRLRFLSDNVFVAIFSSAIKIGMTYFMMGIVFNILVSSGTGMFTKNSQSLISIETVLSFLIYVALALYLSFVGPKIALSLVCGMPQIGMSQLIRAAGHAISPASTAMRLRSAMAGGLTRRGRGGEGLKGFISQSGKGGGSGFSIGSKGQKNTAASGEMKNNFGQMYGTSSSQGGGKTMNASSGSGKGKPSAG